MPYRPPAASTPKPRRRRRPPPAAPRSRAAATREGGIGTQPSPPKYTPAQRRAAQKLISSYEAGPRIGNLGHALDRVGAGYQSFQRLTNRDPTTIAPGLRQAGETLATSLDPIVLGQQLSKSLRHPLAARSSKELNAGIVVGGPGGFKPGRPSSIAKDYVERPRTKAEAEARLAHLEGQQAKFHKAVEGRYKSVLPEEQLRLSKAKGIARKAAKSTKPIKGGKKAARVQQPMGSVADEFLQRAVDEAVAKHPKHPAVKAYLANIDEINQLRGALSSQHMPGETPAGASSPEHLKAQKEWQDYATKLGEREVSGPHPSRPMYDKLARLRTKADALAPKPADYGTVREPVAKAGPLVLPKKVADVPAVPGLERTPAEAQAVVSGALGSARRAYGKQKLARSEELGRRVAKAQSAQEQAGGGIAGVRAAKSQLKGQLPAVQFEKLRQGKLSQQDLEGLVKHLQEHPSPDLNWFDKNIIGPDALTSAFKEGRVPAPHEIDVLRKAFGEDAAKVMAHKSFARKVGENAIGVWNLPRALAASIDVSFPGRQGIGVLAADPKVWAQGWKPQMKALPGKAGERFYRETLDKMHRDPYFGLSQEAGVKYTELGRGSAMREEPFVSKFSENIPGVRASARAYTLYGDHVRLNLFKHYVDKAEKQGVNVESMNELRSIAKIVNTLSGRGGGKRLAQASNVASAFFFAPQLIASRVNMLNPAYGRTLTPFARRQFNIARARLGLGAATVLTGASLAGAKVSSDPRNADFAKIKVGNTRFDVLAGLQQYPRAISQIASGKIVSSTTGRTMKLGPGFGQLNRWDIAERFGASKLNPSASLIYDWAHGHDFIGNKFSWPQAIKQRTIPLSVQDALDARQGKKTPGAAAKVLGGYAISATGVGEQTYGDTASKKAAKKVKAAIKTQDVHLDNLVRKGLLPRKHRAKMRVALTTYDERNQLYTTIENATQNSSGSTSKPLLREQRKMDALLTLLGEHKWMAPAEVSKAKRYYRTTKLDPKEISRQREWIWRNHGPGAWITWYRDKAGAND